ncbi:NAD(P)/FAD-dependent oxidoreductase [Aureimonas sp. OT7]|uniref:NAD(P)/FAD-dependent oxidoreductase n=1 Tax=Aureimonas sp. OT7 TaxID=2816454 RepID=UPI001786D08B|nr:NAD(P)/FAD-dependent oxidoreductase [Aureimonas sp. OT7]QOG07123.1 NAD(P)/FAD-dependent oxidoreductase [Aureimonas sp. OT7]
MTNVGIVGAGAMGLAAAYHALKAGHTVTLYEGDSVPGGMAAHFDFAGVSIERFYHFVCKADLPLFSLMDEIGIADKMIWRSTSMGYFIDDRHYDWGDPVSLLKFPKLDLLSKLRYGATAFWQTKRRSFADLEKLNAKEWFIRSMGKRTYELLWRRLIELKFFDYSNSISAAWLATRIKRVGTSRKSMFQEELGYIEGGSQTLVSALVREIERLGGIIRLNDPIVEIATRDGKLVGVRTRDGGLHEHTKVISTVPTPYVSALVPGLPDEWKEKYDAIANIGCVCVILKLRKPVTRHFWLNVNDPRIDIPGIVEFSNLRALDDHVVYVPYYMPQDHPKFGKDNAFFEEETKCYLRILNPTLSDNDFVDIRIGRLRYAQPVCEPGFADKIPDVQTPIPGLQIADTCYYYPEDRGISESVRFAKELVGRLGDPAGQIGS